ncbi:GntR family transcriptional regulator [Streptomyces cavernae]|uniref:GntR family transcriptional regulator n=1 Tax=Streptomyces cavernae TaxID=2259034 RepID=UPI000FEBD431|nr:GntR family transcriptional regulator [Streptomyces cavernae]
MSADRTGDGGGKEFERVSDALRARMADGTYPLGSHLPPQRKLALEFQVSRDTVQRVIRELANEGWIKSRQGSGSKVVSVIKTQLIQSPTAAEARPGRTVTLGPLISKAFEQPEVTLDVYTLTSETLDAHIRLQAERIRAKEIAPERIALRMLLPSEELDLPYPRSKEDVDDPRMRGRLLAITRRHTASLRNVLRELETENLVSSVEVEIRHAPLTPAFKLYLFNEGEVLHGMYEVIERPIVLDDGREVLALDVLGLGATLTHFVRDDDVSSQGSVFVDSMQSWFDSVWHHLTG